MKFFLLFTILNICLCQIDVYGRWTSLKDNVANFVSNSTSTLPGGRYDGMLIPSSNYDRLVLLGGTDKNGAIISDAWTYFINGTWSLTKFGMPSYNDITGKVMGIRTQASFGMSGTRRIIFAGHNDSSNFNDVWSVDATTLQFTHILNGEDPCDNLPNYNNSDIPTPGSRALSSLSMISNTSFAVFGGYGIDENGDLGDLADVFVFTDSSFRFLAGDKTRNFSGSVNYTTKVGVPAARHSAATYIYGGLMYIYGGVQGSSYYSDFWNLNLTSGVFTLILGNATANSGTRSTSLPGNIAGAVFFALDSTSIALFGGNDLNTAYYDIYTYTLGSSVITKWTPLSTYSTLPLPRTRTQTALFDNKLYVFGGINGTSVNSDLYLFQWLKETDLLYDILLIVFLVVVPFSFFTILVLVFLAKAIYDAIIAKKKKSPSGSKINPM